MSKCNVCDCYVTLCHVMHMLVLKFSHFVM